MKKIFIIILLLVTFLSLSVFSACDSEKEGTAEKSSTEATGKTTTKSVSTAVKSMSWPDWVPDAIPQYKHGDLYFADSQNDMGTLLFHGSDMDMDSFESYINDLKKEGWIEDEDWVFAYDETENADVIYMLHEEYYLIYSVGEDEEGFYAVITYFERDESSDLIDEDNKDTIIIEGEDGEKIIMGNEEIPEGYPNDFIEIYQPSEIIMANKSTDGDSSIYIIMLITKDDETEVSDFYNDLYAEQSTVEFMLILSSEDGSLNGTIQISQTEEEHASQGYETFIMIMVTEN